MGTLFQPDKFFDAQVARDLFEKLLLLETDARILVICADSGMGKSQLLHQLAFRCRTGDPPIPVSLVPLEQLSMGQPLDLLRTIVDDLWDGSSLRLPTFSHLIQAYAGGDFGPFQDRINLRSAPIQASINLQDANLSEADVRISTYNVEHAGVVNLPPSPFIPMDPAQRRTAEGMSIDAFFADIKELCETQMVVLLLDTYEQTLDPMQQWLIRPFLQRHFFDMANRPARLLLVVAGQKPPPFETQWNDATINRVVLDRCKLGPWNQEIIDEILRAERHQFDAADVDVFYRMANQQFPPALIMLTIQTARGRTLALA